MHLLKVCAWSTLLTDCHSVLLYVTASGLIPACIFGRAHSSLVVQIVAIGLVFIGILLLLA